MSEPIKLSKESIAMAAQCWRDETTKNTEMDTVLATVFARKLDEEHKRMLAIIEYGWSIIANANGGNWDTASQEWKEAAWRFEKDFYTNIRRYEAGLPVAFH